MTCKVERKIQAGRLRRIEELEAQNKALMEALALVLQTYVPNMDSVMAKVEQIRAAIKAGEAS
jgi:hypothetical protein